MLNIPGTDLSSAICLTTDPLKLKKIFILVCKERRQGDTAGWLVCLGEKKKTCCSVCVPCAQPLHISAHYSPRERALSVIILKPTQPLMLSHASSQNSFSRLSHSGSWFPHISFFHNLIQLIFVIAQSILCLHWLLGIYTSWITKHDGEIVFTVCAEGLFTRHSRYSHKPMYT